MDLANDEFLQLTLVGILVMLLLALTVVILYVIYQRRYWKQQRAFNRLEAQQQRRLLSATVAAQEAERRRIATDLHDDVGILLTTSQLFIRQIPELPATVELRQTSLDLIDNSLERVRAICRGLATDSLLQFGLIPAVKDVIDLLERGNNTPMIELYAGSFGRLPAEQELALFRISKELLTNGVKHSRAGTIALTLLQEDGIFSLAYADDGVGIQLPEGGLSTLDGGGLGLHSIQARAALLGANLTVRSAPATGFELKLTFSVFPR